jgi:hypothetical protein
MSLRYYVLGSVILFSILYFSKEIRDIRLPVQVSPSLRHSIDVSHPSVEENGPSLEEKTALEEWIQSRLTQKGLKDMTESGHLQSNHSIAL